MLRYWLYSFWYSFFGFLLLWFFILFIGLNLSLNHFSKEIIFQLFINSFLSIKVKCILNFFDVANNLIGFEISIINWSWLVRNVLKYVNNTLISSSNKLLILWFFWEWETIFIIFFKFKPFNFKVLIIFRNKNIQKFNLLIC